eukprot:SAG31_NODE_17043_length_685_cov_1.373720_2_plen_82_part_01
MVLESQDVAGYQRCCTVDCAIESTRAATVVTASTVVESREGMLSCVRNNDAGDGSDSSKDGRKHQRARPCDDHPRTGFSLLA